MRRFSQNLTIKPDLKVKNILHIFYNINYNTKASTENSWDLDHFFQNLAIYIYMYIAFSVFSLPEKKLMMLE
jgi:hypothetical protein